jgi:hypothetical protein
MIQAIFKICLIILLAPPKSCLGRKGKEIQEQILNELQSLLYSGGQKKPPTMINLIKTACQQIQQAQTYHEIRQPLQQIKASPLLADYQDQILSWIELLPAIPVQRELFYDTQSQLS